MEKVFDKATKYIRFVLSTNDLTNISYEQNKQINIIGVGMDMIQTNFNSFNYLHCYSFEDGKLSITIGKIDNNQYKMIVSVSKDHPSGFSLRNTQDKYVYHDVGRLFNEVHNELDGLQDLSISSISEILNEMEGYEKWNRDYKINEIIK